MKFWNRKLLTPPLHVCSVMSYSAAPRTAACQALLYKGFPLWEYWSGLSFPPPGDLPNSGTETVSPASLALSGWLYHWATWEPTMLMDFPSTCHIVAPYLKIQWLYHLTNMLDFIYYIEIYTRKYALISTTSFWRLILVFIYFISNPHIQ